MLNISGLNASESGMRAVLFDMDGTLVDSEKLWEVSLQQLCRRLGGELSPAVRRATVGASADNVMQIIAADLQLDLDTEQVRSLIEWLHNYTGELFKEGLPWCAGARELLDELASEQVLIGLVTNTPRVLTECALNSIGRHYFSVTVCADEVTWAKPAPEPYERAAMLLGVDPHQCLVIEDSITGAAAAEAAGCPVLVVPNDVAVPMTTRRYHVPSLAEVDMRFLNMVYTELELGRRYVPSMWKNCQL